MAEMPYRAALSTVLALLLLFSPGVEADWRAGEMQVRLADVDDRQLAQIAALGIACDHSAAGTCLLYVTPSELALLRQRGFHPQITIRDLQAFSLHRRKDKRLAGYTDVAQAEQLVDSLVEAYPEIIKRYDYGRTAGGLPLFAVKISDRVHLDEAEPTIGIDAGIHGDELTGSELLLRWMKNLASSYAQDRRITQLIDQREIWLFPFANPDGRRALSRGNANGVDLNRDFGYMWDGWGQSKSPFSQPETRALLSWMMEHRFSVQLSLHSGSKMVCMPWSYRPETIPDLEHFAPFFEMLSDNPLPESLPYGNGFERLYPINGNVKDAAYGMHGSLAATLELGEQKLPDRATFEQINEAASDFLLQATALAGAGLRGSVVDAITGAPVAAILRLRSPHARYWPVYSSPANGDFYKWLKPGEYQLSAEANGYATMERMRVVVSDTGATRVRLELHPAPQMFGYRVIGCQIPGNNFSDAGLTFDAIGAPDRQRYSLGRNGWIIIDMGDPVADLPGNDLRVVEGDISPEGFSLSVAKAAGGPWLRIGSAIGTSEFDISGSGVDEFRFLRLEDDGDGIAGVPDAGFDLDAIESLLLPDEGPYPVVTGLRAIDTLSNYNGHIEAGERVAVILSISNLGREAGEDISVSITSESSDMIIEQMPQSSAYLRPGETIKSQPIWLMVHSNNPGPMERALRIEFTDRQSRRWVHRYPVSVHGSPRITLSSMDVAFGKRFVGFDSRQAIRLANSGADTLKIFKLTSSDPAFQVPAQQLVLAPGAERLLELNFLPLESRQYSGELKILSNDPTRPVTHLKLSGYGAVAPEISLSRDSLALTLAAGDSMTVLVSIENIGEGLLYCQPLLSFERPDLRWFQTLSLVPLDSNLAGNYPEELAQARAVSIAAAAADVAFQSNFAGLKVEEVGITRDGRVRFRQKAGVAGLSAAVVTLLPFGPQMRADEQASVRILEAAEFLQVSWNGLRQEEHRHARMSLRMDATGLLNIQLTEGAEQEYPFSALLLNSSGDTTRISGPDADTQQAAEFVITGESWATTDEGVVPVSAGMVANLPLKISAARLNAGYHTATLQLLTNDPGLPRIAIPVHLQVKVLLASGEETVPDRLVLHQNYPNPFNPSTTLAFELPARTKVYLTVYNALGQVVRSLLADDLDAGEYQLLWDGKNDYGLQMPSGVYFYELRSSSVTEIKKMILLH